MTLPKVARGTIEVFFLGLVCGHQRLGGGSILQPSLKGALSAPGDPRGNSLVCLLHWKAPATRTRSGAMRLITYLVTHGVLRESGPVDPCWEVEVTEPKSYLDRYDCYLVFFQKCSQKFM